MVKATGLHNISARFLKLAGTAIITPMAKIFNQSLSQATVPLSRKRARLRTILKKGETSERENYRPLSILSIPSMERTVSNAVIDHTTVQHDLLCKHQWAYKKGCSTEMLIVHMTEKWRSALDQGKAIGMVFIEFRKTFFVSYPAPLQTQELWHYG